MLDIPEYNTISIDSYYQEISQIFMLSLHLFVTNSLNPVYLEVISNIECYISQEKYRFTKEKNTN